MTFPRKSQIILFNKSSSIYFSNKSSSSSSSIIRKSWLERQQKDKYVKKAKQIGVPSRAIFKLEQIDKMVSNLLIQKIKKRNKKINNNGSNNNISNDKSSSKEMRMIKKNGLFEKGYYVLDLGAAPGSWSMYAHQKITHVKAKNNNNNSNGLLVSVDLCPLSNTTLKKLQQKSDELLDNNNFYFLQGDFCSNTTQQSIKNILFDKQQKHQHQQQKNMKEEEKNSSNNYRRYFFFDVIMSDMAANFTGDQQTDALRTMNLCEEALLVALGPNKFFSNDFHNNNKKSDQQSTSAIQKLDNDINNNNNDDDDGILNKHGVFVCKYFTCGQNQEKDLMDKVKRYFEHSFILKPKASRKESSEKYLVAYDYKG